MTRATTSTVANILAVRPTFDLHPFRVSGKLEDDGKTITLWAQDHEGWLTMDAIATLRSA